MSNELRIDSEYALQSMIESLRFINRTISQKLVIDWCLKCHRFLEFSRSFFNPNRVNNPLKTKRFVISKCRLKPHEFLSLMCNSLDRQKLLLSAHNPDFNPKKVKISEDVEDQRGEFHHYIFSLDTSKHNFVDKKPTDFIIDELNNEFNAAVNPLVKET